MVTNGHPNGHPLAIASGQKDVDEQAIKQSVRDLPKHQANHIPGNEFAGLFILNHAVDEFEPWGLNHKHRDRQLRAFIPSEPTFASALGIVCSSNSAYKWELDGPPRTVDAVQNMLLSANDGAGWQDLVNKVSIDLFTQDNGAFIEIVRDGKKPTSAPIGLNHLDSARAWHTGDPRAPVVYQDRMGKLHLMNWWEVITLADMPCAIEGKYGLQYCALTRLLLSARIMKNIAIYEDEKSGGRHTRGIFLVAGMTTEQIRTALQEQRAVADSAGLRRFVLPPILGSVDPQAKVDVKEINFAGLPDNFDKEVANKLYINSIAMAFQRDYQDFAPLPGGGLGTSAQSHVLNMKSRGKGPGLFMAMLTHAINHRVLPDNVEFSFHEQDLDAEQAEAVVKEARARTRQLMVMTGSINAAESRQLAADDGDIPPEFLNYDITPNLTADDDDQIDPADKPKPLKPPAGTPDAVAQQATPTTTDQKLQSGEKSAYRHDQCMASGCIRPPTYEVLWAEGRAHAWFCDDDLHAWEAEHPYEINAFWPLADGRASRNVPRNKALANVGMALLTQ